MWPRNSRPALGHPKTTIFVQALTLLGHPITTIFAQALLALSLLHERAIGKASAWAPYIGILPTADELDVPLLWSDAERAGFKAIQ